MILSTFNGKEMYVSREQAEAINLAISNEAKMIEIGECFVATGAIATIIPGGEPPADKSTRIAAKHQLTDEEAKAKADHNREVLAKMKADLKAKGIKGF